MYALKTGLNADKFATFWMFPKRFYHSFVLQTTITHSMARSHWRQVDLRDFETQKRMNQGKKQCWALFVISNFFSTLIDHYTIKFRNFVSIKNF